MLLTFPSRHRFQPFLEYVSGKITLEHEPVTSNDDADMGNQAALEETRISVLRVLKSADDDILEAPRLGDTVTIHYDARLAPAAAEPFDSTRQGEPFTFMIGAAKVIHGLERAVSTMRPGDRREVFVPSGLAYGSLGAGDGVVPPFADLVFDIELLTSTRGA